MRDKILTFLSAKRGLIILVVCLAVLVLGVFAVYLASITFVTLSAQTDLVKSELSLQSIENKRDTLSLAKSIATLEQELGITKSQNSNLLSAIEQERNKITALSGTVGDLDKLSKTDSELLQKYSNFFFLKRALCASQA